ncbi:hypothetical protein DNTS_008760 [Danionella cerebrum]|uniref:Uncharacterized protein n=1 Tax=Danionella cerebrum TaxID=2873325 RepID=A0A553QZF3_9TELE|nr:hypothetical protein DNTS_008760 [Danionella translucida]
MPICELSHSILTERPMLCSVLLGAVGCEVGYSFGRALPHRRVTFSTANQAQDLQDPSQHSYYDSGLEESETPSSKSSSGPRIGPLALPEDHYERTTPDGSIGEMEHPENVRLLPLQDCMSLSAGRVIQTGLTYAICTQTRSGTQEPMAGATNHTLTHQLRRSTVCESQHAKMRQTSAC